MALFTILTISLISLLNPSLSNPNPSRTTIIAYLSSSPHHRSSNLSDHLHHIATASLNRARHIKNPTTKLNSYTITTPLSPHSYGTYSISLQFGSPPQTLPVIMDTGSSLVWFPCTSAYLCSQCSSGDATDSKVKTFLPQMSSSSKSVTCNNPKCEIIFGPNVGSECGDSESCPAYQLEYGTGSTSGYLLTDTLNFPDKRVPDFLVGCSVFSTDVPSGIAGFGRAKESLPAQMGVKKFSYCMLSHRFDDTPKSTDLILDTAGGIDTPGLNYTSFQKNPVAGNAAFKEYYYLPLRQVIVGDTVLDVPCEYAVPGPDGNGGAIVDSGTTFTYMERPLYDLVAKEFEKEMSRYRRDFDAEMMYGLGPCFDISGDKSVSYPKLTFGFKSGAKMVLPVADYFSMVEGPDVVCLTIVTDGAGAELNGPAIILGNYQQQDFYLEYDLENNRFGFKRQNCG